MSPPELPPDFDQPVFAEPWQAEAFAIAVALNERGVFTWTEWAETLGAELKDSAPDGSDYYEHWLAALDALIRAKGIAAAPEIADLTAAWQRAALATPHGKPIVLENDPERHG